jgi:hypothetical protein
MPNSLSTGKFTGKLCFLAPIGSHGCKFTLYFQLFIGDFPCPAKHRDLRSRTGNDFCANRDFQGIFGIGFHGVGLLSVSVSPTGVTLVPTRSGRLGVLDTRGNRSGADGGRF